MSLWKSFITGALAKIGQVGAGNYFEVEADGTIVFNGDATVWDETSESFIGSNIFTVAGRVDYNFDELTLDFATNARYPEEPVGAVKQSPHKRKANSDFRPHIHWMQNSDNNPNILIQYRTCNNNGVPSSWTLKALTSSDNAFPFSEAGQMQITNFNLPSGHGQNLGLSGTFEVKVYRDSTNASGLFSGADNYSGDWNAKYYDIHWLYDTVGSRQEFVK